MDFHYSFDTFALSACLEAVALAVQRVPACITWMLLSQRAKTLVPQSFVKLYGAYSVAPHRHVLPFSDMQLRLLRWWFSYQIRNHLLLEQGARVNRAVEVSVTGNDCRISFFSKLMGT